MQEYQEISIDEIDALTNRPISLGRARLLVLAFVLSVGACFAAVWFSGILLSAPDQLLGTSFLQFVVDYRLLVLLAPAICLVVCYMLLRSLTREIMGVPERYLDERQRALRDQAHRSAFKLTKLAGMLTLVGLLVPHLPWFQATPTVYTSSAFAYTEGVSLTYLISTQRVYTATGKHLTSVQLFRSSTPAWYEPLQAISTTDIILASVVLLLCVWLLASALPMCVLAWKGKS